ncbi:hypothetical protein SD70_22820 [Gordoniibacillus kamchatkensis]|uniref:DUF2905 domain-containing protein n=1 Tax=Gordoniibacillus kamchatkensis TaxID=1590651 RepID=A0ABR5AEF9_9BACL|nr:DUF2905 domain-containing protein [Paenibacillus sp. VKM B-2647]KIL38980.1 hypothetical protein SD70_22820 [Paenibacillus sp. VKM B-2647]
MGNVPKFLIITGIVLVAAGLLWPFLGKYLHLGRLPGDIAVKKENFTFYFPVVTCIVISVGLSLLMYIIRWFMK